MGRLRIILFAALWAGPALPAETASDLARVGIVRFINNTDSEDFEWVEKSLPDAIDLSMKSRFEYIRLEESKVQAAAAQVAPARVATGGDGGTRYSKEDAATISRLSQADILIYGNFIADRERGELILHAVIFNAAGNKVIGHVENRTPMNAKIFKNIDQMAAEIVSEIYRFALQSSQSAAASKKNLKLLVLVPSYSNKEEESMAKAELQHLKKELSVRTPGRYITIFEFYDEYHVTHQEQEISLGYARKRERQRLQLWLENYGITDAMIVLVSDNKVNITAMGANKVAQVSYDVGATPEEKQKQIIAAQEQVSPKVELKKDFNGGEPRFNLYWGAAVSKGLLTSGDKLGVMTGISVHGSARLTRYFEPHVRIEGYYGFPKDNVERMLSGSILAGPGYTLTKNKFAFSPYAAAGIFLAEIKAAAGNFSVLLPAAGGGFLLSYYMNASWGFTLQGHGQYVFDPSSPALFLGASLSTVVRF